jgi:hypothetical protein
MEGGEQKQVRMRAGGKRPTDPQKAAFLPPTLAPLPDAKTTHLTIQHDIAKLTTGL